MAVFPNVKFLLFAIAFSSALFSQSISVVLISPSEGAASEDDTPALSWMATHAMGSQMACNIYIDGSVALPNVPVKSGVSYIASVPFQLSGGNHKWFVSCWDSMHNSQASGERTYTVLAQPQPLAAAILGTANEYEEKDAGDSSPSAAASMAQPSLDSQFPFLFIPAVLLPAILLIILLWSKKGS